MRLSIALAFLLVTASTTADDHGGLLSREERAWLDSLEEPLVVGLEGGYRPYAFIDEEGNYNGVAGEYLNLLEQRLGIRFVVRKYDTFAAMIDAARMRQIDVVPFVIATEERRAYLDFSQSVFENRDRILVRTESTGVETMEDLAGLRLGVVEAYVANDEVRAGWPEVIIVPVPNELEAIRALSLGRLDAAIVDVGVASYYIEQENISNLRVAAEFGDVGYQTFGVRNDWPILTSIIGKGLASISPEEHDEIRRRWINIGGVDPGVLDRLWAQFGVALTVLFAVLIGVLAWSVSLKRLVARRTGQLEQEFAERRLVESAKERLAVAVEQSAEYVLVIDVNGNVEYANMAFVETQGGQELKGVALPATALASSRETLVEALKSARDVGTWRGRVELAGADTGAIKVAMAIAPIYSDATELDGYVVNARDISNEEKLEARLRQGEKLSSLGTLASGIAHDFNNLLVPILGYADLLRKEGIERIAPYVNGIVDASERARELVKQILIFGRSGAAALEPLDLRREIGDASNLIESLLPAKVDLSTELLECRSVMGDRSQIQQLLVNLCSNASDAMIGRGGTIDIRLEPGAVLPGNTVAPRELTPGEYALLTVTDDGEGMDEETLARIFDPYFTEKPYGKGTGLGLAIVHGVVSAHGGAIQVNSRPGEGTSVRIYFPTVDARAARGYVDPRSEIRRGKGERIMILDDDEMVLRTVDIMVQSLGYEGCKWSDPVAALEAFREAPESYDAILADFKMPELTGLEFAEHARRIRPEIPIIIMTGNTGVLRDSGVDYIAKPLSLAQLADCLLGFVARK